jgi:hypothetical protein
MKPILACILFSILAITAFAKPADTIHVKPADVDVKSLRRGTYNYIIYFRKTKESPANRMTLVRMDVADETYNGKPAITVRQQWESDTVTHSAFTVFSPADFSTLLHDTWWKSIGYGMKFDFVNKKVEVNKITRKGGVPDSVLRIATADFNQSFEKYNLNWHDDLLIYTMLPYKDNRTLVINYYDPGFGKAEEVPYSVSGSDVLTGSNGEKIDCWVLIHADKNFTEKYWISKKTREVLKEEDAGPNIYRYKIKLGISGDK